MKVSCRRPAGPLKKRHAKKTAEAVLFAVCVLGGRKRIGVGVPFADS